EAREPGLAAIDEQTRITVRAVSPRGIERAEPSTLDGIASLARRAVLLHRIAPRQAQDDRSVARDGAVSVWILTIWIRLVPHTKRRADSLQRLPIHVEAHRSEVAVVDSRGHRSLHDARLTGSGRLVDDGHALRRVPDVPAIIRPRRALLARSAVLREQVTL